LLAAAGDGVEEPSGVLEDCGEGLVSDCVEALSGVGAVVGVESGGVVPGECEGPLFPGVESGDVEVDADVSEWLVEFGPELGLPSVLPSELPRVLPPVSPFGLALELLEDEEEGEEECELPSPLLGLALLLSPSPSPCSPSDPCPAALWT
jgi:hypothetical protein